MERTRRWLYVAAAMWLLMGMSAQAMDGGPQVQAVRPVVGVLLPPRPDGRLPVPELVRGVAWRRMDDAEAQAIVAMSPLPPGRWSHVGLIASDGTVWALEVGGVRRMTMAEWRQAAQETGESDQIRCRRWRPRPVSCTHWGLGDEPGACTCTEYVAQALGLDMPRRAMGHIHPDDMWAAERRIAGRICGCPLLDTQ